VKFAGKKLIPCKPAKVAGKNIALNARALPPSRISVKTVSAWKVLYQRAHAEGL
jgi:hypothetical protein